MLRCAREDGLCELVRTHKHVWLILHEFGGRQRPCSHGMVKGAALHLPDSAKTRKGAQAASLTPRPSKRCCLSAPGVHRQDRLRGRAAVV